MWCTLHRRTLGTVLLAALLACGAAGCAPKYKDLQHFVQTQDEQDVAATNYRIEPPDVIAISSPSAPEIDNETQVVRSDGKVSLKLLGEVKVAGLTPRQLASRLEDLLGRYYVSPKVNVRVVDYNSKKLYVMGQVSNGGMIPFTGSDRVLDVISKAGPTFIAWNAQVKVIRPSASADERHEVVVDVDKIMQKGDLQANFLLKEGDIVYVPPTPLGWFGLRVRELFWPFQPVVSAYTGGADLRRAHHEWTDSDPYGDDDDDNDSWKRDAIRLIGR